MWPECSPKCTSSITDRKPQLKSRFAPFYDGIMRSLLVPLLLTCAFYVAPGSAQDDVDTVEWFGDYQKALEEAKRTNKPIFLEFRCEA